LSVINLSGQAVFIVQSDKVFVGQSHSCVTESESLTLFSVRNTSCQVRGKCLACSTHKQNVRALSCCKAGFRFYFYRWSFKSFERSKELNL